MRKATLVFPLHFPSESSSAALSGFSDLSLRALVITCCTMSGLWLHIQLSLVFLLLIASFFVYADNSKDVSDEETIAQLKLALFDLTESHKKLCDEMAFLSGYVALHERALQVTLRSHDWRRNLLRAHHRHQKETHMTGGDRQDDSDTNSRAESAHQSLPQPETTTASLVPLEPFNETANLAFSGSINHARHTSRQHDDHHINQQENLIDSSECQLKVQDTCSVLRQVVCRHGHLINASRPFDEQFNQWFASLTAIHQSDSMTSHTRGRMHERQHFPSSHIHLRRHDGRAKLNVDSDSRKSLSTTLIDNDTDDFNSTGASENGKNSSSIPISMFEMSGADNHSASHPSKRSNDWSDSLIVPQYIQEMESSIANENNGTDFIYATCEVEANRAISLLLQQNIQGRINLWQRRDSGPVYAYIKLSGFRVASHRSRARRETVLMPVETPARDAEKPSDAVITSASREHAFHVHTLGDLSRSCQSTGPHFNASSPNNGSSPHALTRPMGDLGNLKCQGDGTIDAEYSYPHVSLLGPNSIIGKSLVIHSAPDTYANGERVDETTSSPSDSRVRIACCVVQPVVSLPPMDDSPSLIGSLIVPSDQINNQGGK